MLRSLWLSFVRKSPHRLGRYGEHLAQKYLRARHYSILERNWQTPFGEIDLIAADRNTLIIIEVKTRRAEIASIFAPDKAVTREKTKRLIKLARLYIQQNQVTLSRRRLTKLRFDIIAITVSARYKAKLDHIKSESFVGFSPNKH